MLANCMDCGKLIDARGLKIFCTECTQKREKNYQAVKDYLIQKPNAQIDEVVEKTGVDFWSVREFLDDGRLKGEFSNEFAGQKICEGCGTPVSVGAYCSKCHVALSASADNKGVDTKTSAKQNQQSDFVGFKKIEKKEKGRMHTRRFGRNR